MRTFYLIVLISFLFYSCEKCNVYYVDDESIIRSIELECKLNFYDINTIDNSLDVLIKNKNTRLTEVYFDSINVYPIFEQKDTLKLRDRFGNSRFLFEANEKKYMEKLNIEVHLYSRDATIHNDTVIIFKNLKRVEKCYNSTAFH